MKTTTLFVFCLLATAIFATEYQVEPFTAGEGRAIEIYDEVLPLLEASEDLFEDDAEVTFDAIAALAKKEKIDIQAVKAAVLADPEMAVFALDQLQEYSSMHRKMVEQGDEPQDALLFAAEWSDRQATVLEILIEQWAPEAFEEDKED